MTNFLILLLSVFSIAFAEDQLQICDEVDGFCDQISCPFQEFESGDIHLVKDLLREAETYYQLARETENGYFIVESSATRYVQSRLCLEKLPENIRRQPDIEVLYKRVKEAEVQSVYRLDNAHDTYRTVMWPIWWITESDPTVEWYDDVYMKAVDLLWTKIAHRIERYPIYYARSYMNE